MVTWNGNTYTCAAKSNADSYNDIYIGNPVYGYLDGYQFSPNVQNTKDPFCIYYSAEDEDCIILYSYGAFNTCSIAKIEYTVHALDPKYLPIDVAFKSDFEGLKEQVNNIGDLVGDTAVSEQITNAVSQKSQVQIITWEADD
jgi:hypothetical protein